MSLLLWQCVPKTNCEKQAVSGMFDFFQFCLGVFGGVLVRVLVLTNPDSKASRRSILVLLAVGATIRSRTHTLPCTLKTDRLVAPPHASRNSQAACTTLEANWCVTNLTIPLKSNVQAAAYLSKSLPFWAKPCTTKLSYLSHDGMFWRVPTCWAKALTHGLGLTALSLFTSEGLARGSLKFNPRRPMVFHAEAHWRHYY